MSEATAVDDRRWGWSGEVMELLDRELMRREPSLREPARRAGYRQALTGELAPGDWPRRGG